MDELVLASLRGVKGIEDVQTVRDEDRSRILDIEKDAEERSLMGLGKVVNTGVREALAREAVYVALTTMEFDWSCHTTLLLKKGEEEVGKEVRDEETIAKLSGQKNVWFMHRNFVVYKDKICFPQDIMTKVCHFEIPPLQADWCRIEKEGFSCSAVIFANPATPSDLFLKENYFGGKDERGLGTILIGVQP